MSDPTPRASATRWLERLLWMTGLVLLIWVGYVWADGRTYQARAEAELDRAIAEARLEAQAAERTVAVDTRVPADRSTATRVDLPDVLPGDREESSEESEAESAPAPVLTIGDAGVVGKLEVPRLGLSVMVSEGTSSRVLRRGAGHLSNTPLPGAPGNAAIAGHRDRHFRPLRTINPGDEVIFTGIDGTYRYEVEFTEIVEPDEIRVLRPTDEPSLTLVTCFPFSYVGNAPQRFIVRAKQIEAEPVAVAASGG